jgi:hypothetical protein
MSSFTISLRNFILSFLSVSILCLYLNSRQNQVLLYKTKEYIDKHKQQISKFNKDLIKLEKLFEYINSSEDCENFENFVNKQRIQGLTYKESLEKNAVENKIRMKINTILS